MNDNWVIKTEVSVSAEKIFSIMTSFLGINGSLGAQEQISERCRPGALDCINAAIHEVNKINREFSNNDITPSVVTSFEESVTAVSAVAYNVLPLRAATFLALRYDVKTAQILQRIYDMTFEIYHGAAPAKAGPISEAY